MRKSLSKNPIPVLVFPRLTRITIVRPHMAAYSVTRLAFFVAEYMIYSPVPFGFSSITDFSAVNQAVLFDPEPIMKIFVLSNNRSRKYYASCVIKPAPMA